MAEQLGCRADADDETVLSFAADADQLTLNRLARAIRRYSTARARESWAECNVQVARFSEARHRRSAVVLCLRCVRVEFDEGASRRHQGAGCVPITLANGEVQRPEGDIAPPGAVAERVQRLVEEFRALRAAFGLPHFDLDCYVRGDQLTLMWRPLP